MKTFGSIIREMRAGVKSPYKSLNTAIRSIYERKIETHFKDQIVVGQYRTQNFEMCPAAQKLYVSLPFNVDVAKAEQTAILLDKLFDLEKAVTTTERATKDDIAMAKELAEKAKLMAGRAGLAKEHDFIDDHVSKIEKFHKPEASNVSTEDPTPEDLKKLFATPSWKQTPEKRDMDIDNQKFRISRNLKAQRKLKIIDND